ncbi:hypothetical protein [Microvirga tunisiensis]|uniref:Uncharacterized protein n=1 Tax=Microvirga tunisiensis TaxID=2108360 RepID=A0A5N7MUF8_9HYPH|nr:hypothetical protein [Microvirga tunisiensis]MPR11728.1 hypothetical protein [Microvirga tunisiensis]MPR29724.1 hypothetical protein [Microvirga tunisiensis]
MTPSISNALMTAAFLATLYSSREGEDKAISNAFKVINVLARKALTEAGIEPHDPVRMPTFIRWNGKAGGYDIGRVHADPQDRTKDREEVLGSGLPYMEALTRLMAIEGDAVQRSDIAPVADRALDIIHDHVMGRGDWDDPMIIRLLCEFIDGKEMQQSLAAWLEADKAAEEAEDAADGMPADRILATFIPQIVVFDQPVEIEGRRRIDVCQATPRFTR